MSSRYQARFQRSTPTISAVTGAIQPPEPKNVTACITRMSAGERVALNQSATL